MTPALFLRSLFLTLLLGWGPLAVWGQTYTITPVPFAPAPYGGTSLTGQFSSADDGVAGPFPLGFSFCYFGNTYTQFWVGTNGWVSFSPGQPSTYTSAPIPSTNTSVPSGVISPLSLASSHRYCLCVRVCERQGKKAIDVP